MRHLALIAMLLFAGSVSAAECTTLRNGKTMSYWAYQGSWEDVGALIEGGCDVDSTSRITSDGPLLTPLQAAAMTDNVKGSEVIFWIIEVKHADANARGSIGQTPLMLAAIHNRLKAAKTLSYTGGSIDAKDSGSGKTALMFAAEHNKKEMVRFLITLNASLDETDNSGKTALMFAKGPEVLTLLVTAGASTEKTTAVGLTPLHVAAQHISDGYIAELLVKRRMKTKINAFAETTYSTQWSSRETPSMLAAARNQPSEFLRRLIARGANIEASYSDKKYTALHYAARWGHIDNVRQLIEAGADVNAGRNAPGGMSPLFAAVEGAKSIARTEVVKALIGAGGKVTDAAGNKPSIPDSYNDATALKAIIDNPKPHWPIRAYSLGIRFNSTPILDTRSNPYILCHEDNDSCLVYFDCTDDAGAKTGTTTVSPGAMVRYWDKPSNKRPITIAGVLGLGAGQGWSGMLDCALRSQQKMTAQLWARTNATLVNHTGYIRSDKNNEAILQKTHAGGSASRYRMAMRIRCIDKTDCKNTVVKCRGSDGTTASNMSISVGKIDRQKTKALFNYTRGSDSSDFPAGIDSCTVKSEGEFLVQMLAFGSAQMINHTGVSME